MTTDHPRPTGSAACLPERRTRPLVVDLCLAPGDRSCRTDAPDSWLQCDHHVPPAATVAEAVQAALADHPNAHVLGVREPRS